MATKHWYGTGSYDAVNTNGAAGGKLSYWFDDDGAGNRLPTTHCNAPPTAGDLLYFDGGVMGPTLSYDNITWAGIQIAAGQTITLNIVGCLLTLASSCTIGLATQIAGGVGSAVICSAKWMGDILMTGLDGITLGTGWMCNGGNPGGNITLSPAGGANLTIQAPSTTPGSVQAKVFRNISLTTVNADSVSLAGLSGITLLGTLFLTKSPGTSVTMPSGQWLTLGAVGAAALGVVSSSASMGGVLVV